jgi:signal transduction histidine kinase
MLASAGKRRGVQVKLRDPGWVLTIGVGIAALAVAAIPLATRVAVPSEDAVIRTESWAWTSDGVRVEAGSPDSPFRAGDLVVAIDGRPLASWVEGAFTGGSQPQLGDRATFQVVRSGAAQEIVAPLGPLPIERLDTGFAGAAAFGAIVLLLAAVLVARRPRSTALRLLFVAAVANVTDITVWGIGLRPTDVVRGSPILAAFAVAPLFNLLFWSAILHLLAIYPVRSPLVARSRLAVPLIYLAPPSAYLALTLVARVPGGTTLDWIDRLASCVGLVASGMLVAILVATIAGWRRAAPAIQRTVRLVAVSLVAADVATLALLTGPIALTGAPLVARSVVSLFALIVPIALVAAILRDRLFQVALLSRSREKIVAAREDERRRLRRDLHDGLAPSLAAVGLKLDLIRSTVRDDPAAAEQGLDEARHDVRAVIAEIRRMSRELRPPSLDTLGLVGAVRQQAEALGGGDGPRIVVDADPNLPALPAAVEVAAYRIAVEAMMNAVRHAAATTCRVGLALVGDELAIDVGDDGRGLAPSALGVGLRAMRERAAEIGGDVTIESGPQGGTHLAARLPVDLAHLAPGLP